MGCGDYSSQDLGIGFACTIGAGLATIVGAMVVIGAPSLRNRLFLAAALSFASGVMIYVSFVDIYVGKAVGHFEDSGRTPELAFVLATVCFFCGMPIAYILDKFGDWILHRNYGSITGHHHHGPVAIEHQGSTDADDAVAGKGATVDGNTNATVRVDTEGNKLDVEGGVNGEALDPVNRAKLIKAGLLAAMAVAVHNTPEGLVTFVAYLSSISSGITTAVAIAIHNIPEGMVISVPIYYATGSRLKAIGWASVAAVTEPIGALIGLAVACGGSLTDEVFGILFGLVAGIMVYVAVKELSPTARHYDPTDRVSTVSLAFGMIVMACSLIAIAYASAGGEEPSEEDLLVGADAVEAVAAEGAR